MINNEEEYKEALLKITDLMFKIDTMIIEERCLLKDVEQYEKLKDIKGKEND